MATIGHAQLVISERLAKFIYNHQRVEEVEGSCMELQTFFDYPAWVENTVSSSQDVPSELISMINYEYQYSDPAEVEWYEWLRDATQKIEDALVAMHTAQKIRNIINTHEGR